VGAYPNDDESAGVNYSHSFPKGNRNMRRILNQSANAALKAKGSIFEMCIAARYRVLGTNKPWGHCPSTLSAALGTNAFHGGPGFASRITSVSAAIQTRQSRS